ncbi:type III-A CRISPR-associated protein Csm2 [Sulfurimonas hydrogeniphila]|uniref:type III-A CRISPR-associated protein Csm2 n=1 Tax=Sulfurimonas hydrogeniphila TaxID=2509341 RepID=UPI00125FA626|nr:type III-A CRISPR-associated protein Csm2 [Sulfurimonas hydrogeniphila]
MSNIILDYKKDVELFNETAKKWANDIGTGRGGVQNTQIRKFYDQVLDLKQKSKDLSEDEFKTDLLPFVKMLNSKVAYASTRKSAGGNLVNKAFVDMMESCIKQVNSKDKLDVFKLFFEAVVGFHKSLEGRK